MYLLFIYIQVGTGSIVYDGSRISKHGILEAGSILTAGKTIPSRQVWGGNPARFLRDATEEEISNIRKTAEYYASLAIKHEEEHRKTAAQREQERIVDHLLPERPYPDGSSSHEDFPKQNPNVSQPQ